MIQRHVFFWLVFGMAVQHLHSQTRHWVVPNGDIYLLENFNPDPPALFIENIEQKGIYPISNYVVGQDSLGFLWLSGQGGPLLRYDGLSMKKYQPEGLQNFQEGIYTIESVGNQLWLPMKNGLGCYNLTNGNLKTIENNIQANDSLVVSVFYDSRRKKVVVNFGEDAAVKLAVFDPVAGRYTQILDGIPQNAYTGEPLEFSPKYYAEMAMDDNGHYWVNAVFEKDNMLLSLDPESGEWLAYPFLQYRENGKPNPEPWKYTMLEILLDQDGRHIWTSGFYGGLKCFDKVTRRWQQYMVNVPEHEFAANCIVDIAQYNEQTLLLGSNLGLHLFDKRTGRLYNYNLSPKGAGNHFSRTISKVSLDRDGNAWITSVVTGLHKIDPRKQFFQKEHQLPIDFSPYDFYRDKATGKAFFLGINFQDNDCQLLFLNEKTGEYSCQSIPVRLVTLQPDPDKRVLWAGATTGGLWQIDIVSNMAKQVRMPITGLEGATTASLGGCHLSRDASGNMWLGTGKYGLIKYERQHRVFRAIVSKTGQNKLLLSNALQAVFVDKNGSIWVNYLDKKIQFVTKITESSTEDFSSLHFSLPGGKVSISSVWAQNFAETSDKSIWVQGMLQLFRLRSNSDSFELVPDITPTYGIITTDTKGNLWVNSKGRVHCFDASTQRWKHFGSKDGFPLATPYELMSNCYDEKIYFTGTCFWYPADLRFNEVMPRPVFTAFKVNEKELDLNGKDLNFVKELRLEAGQRSFTIEFAGLSYTNSEDNQFAYQLLGLDDNWVFCGNRHTASFTQLPPGVYTFRLQVANSDTELHQKWNQEPAELRIIISGYFYQTTWFKLLAGIVLIAGFYFLWKVRMQDIQNEARLREREAEFQKQLAEVEMSALRSQMNPHFIFNVLNSINRYTLDHDADTASTYLTKFARLVRMVLENSRNLYVTLQSDLTALRLYTEMEAMRFKEKLQFHIEVAPDIDQQYVKIPPMLIQPYVENAIWHGLMHKKSGGTVWIKVMQASESFLNVEIKDDGIGRAAAMVLKSKSAVESKSFGMHITSQRLDLVNKLYHTELSVSVQDLLDRNGLAAGTIVVLKIPV
ncbi:MAG: histidine kinase [Lewinellaceae bacterium]|nr:histidine kinase [Lewinellaceae bacterium]